MLSDLETVFWSVWIAFLVVLWCLRNLGDEIIKKCGNKEEV